MPLRLRLPMALALAIPIPIAIPISISIAIDRSFPSPGGRMGGIWALGLAVTARL